MKCMMQKGKMQFPDGHTGFPFGQNQLIPRHRDKTQNLENISRKSSFRLRATLTVAPSSMTR